MIIIKAKQDGFRRCGIAHPLKPVEYADDHFSKAELATLQGEPRLVVVVEDEDSSKMTVSELTAELKRLSVEIPNGSKKDDLIALYLGVKG